MWFSVLMYMGLEQRKFVWEIVNLYLIKIMNLIWCTVGELFIIPLILKKLWAKSYEYAKLEGGGK